MKKKYNVLIVIVLFIIILYGFIKNNKEIKILKSRDYVSSVSPFDLQGVDVKFYKDLSYDTLQATKLDLFIPRSEKKTGLLIYVHGGGFTSGNKSSIYKNGGYAGNYPEYIRYFLSKGIAVASVNYRLLDDNDNTGVIRSLEDVKYSLQFLRSNANYYNIDKKKVVLTGVSAGAGASLWIATKDDMADPTNKNPILRESTRVNGVALIQTQATYDLERWVSDVFKDYGLKWDDFKTPFQPLIFQFYGIKSWDEYNSNRIISYRKNVDMLSAFTKDDPVIWASNTQSVFGPPSDLDIVEHHAFHVREIKMYADKVGIKNICYYGQINDITKDSINESYKKFIERLLK